MGTNPERVQRQNPGPSSEQARPSMPVLPPTTILPARPQQAISDTSPVEGKDSLARQSKGGVENGNGGTRYSASESYNQNVEHFQENTYQTVNTAPARSTQFQLGVASGGRHGGTAVGLHISSGPPVAHAPAGVVSDAYYGEPLVYQQLPGGPGFCQPRPLVYQDQPGWGVRPFYGPGRIMLHDVPGGPGYRPHYSAPVYQDQPGNGFRGPHIGHHGGERVYSDRPGGGNVRQESPGGGRVYQDQPGSGRRPRG